MLSFLIHLVVGFFFFTWMIIIVEKITIRILIISDQFMLMLDELFLPRTEREKEED